MAKPPWLSLGLLGILLILGGIFSIMVVSSQSQEEVVIEKAGEEIGNWLVVDIGGEVENPGVYEMKPDARVNEALVMAGGLGKEADREWVEKNLNLAAKLTDGQKIYIPSIKESDKDGPSETKGPSFNKININTASVTELDTLWGVGEVTAKKIMDNRPYGAVEELLTKGVLKSNVYEAVKEKISVY